MGGWLNINRLLVPLLLIFTLSAQAVTLEGKVVKIADGDTLTMISFNSYAGDYTRHSGLTINLGNHHNGLSLSYNTPAKHHYKQKTTCLRS